MAENSGNDVTAEIPAPDLSSRVTIDDPSNTETSSSGDDPNNALVESSESPSSDHQSTNSSTSTTITLENIGNETNSGQSAANSTPELQQQQPSDRESSVPNDTGQPPPQQEPVQHRKIFQVTRVLSSSSNDGFEKQELVTDVSRFKSDLLETTRDNNPAPSPSAMRNSAAESLQQYGLAIVDDIDNVSGVPDDKNDEDHVQNRFKVVKVVSTDPLKKGRWECMDYFDHTVSTTTSQPYTSANASSAVTPTNNEILQLQCHNNSQQLQFQGPNSGSPTQQVQPPQFPQQSQQPQISHPSQTLQSPLQQQQPQSIQQPNLQQQQLPQSYPVPQIQQQQPLHQPHYSDISTQPQQVYSQPQTASIHPVIQMGSQQPQQILQQQPMVTSQPQSHQIQAQTPIQQPPPQQGGHILTVAQQQQLYIQQQQQQQQQQQSIPPQQQQARASGSSATAVAIDNKIEQAMDLVKGHLMLAVREEVEVLKEKISELMERIGQLEMENAILKANATAETLLQIQASKYGGGNTPNNNS